MYIVYALNKLLFKLLLLLLLLFGCYCFCCFKKIKLQSSETLMRTTNLQLITEIDNLKNQLAIYTVPSRFRGDNEQRKAFLLSLQQQPGSENNNQQAALVHTARDNTNALNSVRSMIENAMNSIRS